ncbi:MAG: MGMT family protein [Candidatus Aenigmarchaeota archaeon]|nr:MGMT family protein [Candidatus Aenigmarchaeota archaeon]
MSKSLEVLELLRKVPKGKITTYGSLARAAKTSPRAVGQIMRQNPFPDKYPCYKVIASSGKVHGYAGCMKGKHVEKKIRLLKKDGIGIRNGRIDLSYCLHKFE